MSQRSHDSYKSYKKSLSFKKQKAQQQNIKQKRKKIKEDNIKINNQGKNKWIFCTNHLGYYNATCSNYECQQNYKELVEEIF